MAKSRKNEVTGLTDVTIEITGLAPLIMHNNTSVDPFNELTRAMKAISAKKTRKTEDDIRELYRLEWEAGLYWDTDLDVPVIPLVNLKAAFVEGAKITRQGTAVTRGLLAVGDDPVLEYKGSHDRKAMWASGDFTFTKPVKVGQSSVIRCRPIFRQWSLAPAEFQLDESILDLRDLELIVKRAGLTTGLCDYRPRFGRFTAEVTSG